MNNNNNNLSFLFRLLRGGGPGGRRGRRGRRGRGRRSIAIGMMMMMMMMVGMMKIWSTDKKSINMMMMTTTRTTVRRTIRMDDVSKKRGPSTMEQTSLEFHHGNEQEDNEGIKDQEEKDELKLKLKNISMIIKDDENNNLKSSSSPPQIVSSSSSSSSSGFAVEEEEEEENNTSSSSSSEEEEEDGHNDHNHDNNMVDSITKDNSKNKIIPSNRHHYHHHHYHYYGIFLSSIDTLWRKWIQVLNNNNFNFKNNNNNNMEQLQDYDDDDDDDNDNNEEGGGEKGRGGRRRQQNLLRLTTTTSHYDNPNDDNVLFSSSKNTNTAGPLPYYSLTIGPAKVLPPKRVLQQQTDGTSSFCTSTTTTNSSFNDTFQTSYLLIVQGNESLITQEQLNRLSTTVITSYNNNNNQVVGGEGGEGNVCDPFFRRIQQVQISTANISLTGVNKGEQLLDVILPMIPVRKLTTTTTTTTMDHQLQQQMVWKQIIENIIDKGNTNNNNNNIGGNLMINPQQRRQLQQQLQKQQQEQEQQESSSSSALPEKLNTTSLSRFPGSSRVILMLLDIYGTCRGCQGQLPSFDLFNDISTTTTTTTTPTTSTTTNPNQQQRRRRKEEEKEKQDQQRHLQDENEDDENCICPEDSVLPDETSFQSLLNLQIDELRDTDDDEINDFFVDEVNEVIPVLETKCPTKDQDFSFVYLVSDMSFSSTLLFTSLGQQQLIQEIELLFQDSYNTMAQQLCDPLYRTISQNQLVSIIEEPQQGSTTTSTAATVQFEFNIEATCRGKDCTNVGCMFDEVDSCGLHQNKRKLRPNVDKHLPQQKQKVFYPKDDRVPVVNFSTEQNINKINPSTRLMMEDDDDDDDNDDDDDDERCFCRKRRSNRPPTQQEVKSIFQAGLDMIIERNKLTSCQLCSIPTDCQSGVCFAGQCAEGDTELLLNSCTCSRNEECESSFCQNTDPGGDLLPSSGICQGKLPSCRVCNNDDECLSGFCTGGRCAEVLDGKLKTGCKCSSNDNCQTGRCANNFISIGALGTCTERINNTCTESCVSSNDCESGLCGSMVCMPLNGTLLANGCFAKLNTECQSGLSENDICSETFPQITPEPTFQPSPRPSTDSSNEPSNGISTLPSGLPNFPPPSAFPSESPSWWPSGSPNEPLTLSPTAPIFSTPPTGSPNKSLSDSPSAPNFSPKPSGSPSESLSVSPSAPNFSPKPSGSPSEPPTDSPSVSPSSRPTRSPSEPPTDSPSVSPSTGSPSEPPTDSPSVSPSVPPTDSPTVAPSASPSASPSALEDCRTFPANDYTMVEVYSFCNAHIGEECCVGASGFVGDADPACDGWNPASTYTICKLSCTGDTACSRIFEASDGATIEIGVGSCKGDLSCRALAYDVDDGVNVEIGKEACIGQEACKSIMAHEEIIVNDFSCNDYQACYVLGGGAGTINGIYYDPNNHPTTVQIGIFDSPACIGYKSCAYVHAYRPYGGSTIYIGGDGCTGSYACLGIGRCHPVDGCSGSGSGSNSLRISGDSCMGERACDRLGANVLGRISIAFDSCNGENACQYLAQNAASIDILNNICVGSDACLGCGHSGWGTDRTCMVRGGFSLGFTSTRTSCDYIEPGNCPQA